AGWIDQGGPSNLQLLRFNGAGTSLWAGTCGVTVDSSATEAALLPDGAHGAYATWVRFTTGLVRAQHVDAAGGLAWTTGSAGVASGAPGTKRGPQIVVDAEGNVIVAWRDLRNDVNGDVYAQRLSPAGAARWSAGGVAVCSDAAAQDHVALTADLRGGAVAVWL